MSASDLSHHALTHDALTRDLRIWQVKNGHRYSLDDTLVAERACHAAITDARTSIRYLDLGSGTGSVLLMVLWKLREQQVVVTAAAIEAQDVSFALLQKNSIASGYEVEAFHADFRDSSVLEHARAFDLITGTPPYFRVGTATPSSTSEQKTFARIEMRGGVEAYLDAAEELLREDGTLVICGDAKQKERVETHVRLRGAFYLHETTDVIPHPDKAALFSVYVLRRHRPSTPTTSSFLAREVDGSRSAAARSLREYFGLVAT